MIPKRVHRIWLGPHRMPADYVAYGQAWRQLGYAVHDWTEHDLAKVPVSSATQTVINDVIANGTNAGGGIDATGTWVQLADIYSYSLLVEFGGIYANTDIEPLARLPINDLDAFVVAENDRFLSNALMGSTVGHAFFADVADTLPERFWNSRWQPMNQTTGPHHLTHRWDTLGRPAERLQPVPFFPVHFDDETRISGHQRPRSGFYVDHHWGHKHPEHLTEA